MKQITLGTLLLFFSATCFSQAGNESKSVFNEALKLHQVPGTPGWGTEPERFWGKLNTDIEGLHYEGKIETIPGNYIGFYQSIYETIREGKELAVKPEQAMQVIQLIEAAVESNKERKAVRMG